MLTGIDSARLQAGLAKSVPMGRVGEPEEAAATAVFLASDEAKLITGAEFLIDGGVYGRVTFGSFGAAARIRFRSSVTRR